MLRQINRSDLPPNLRKLFDRYEELRVIHQEFEKKSRRLNDEMDFLYCEGKPYNHLRVQYDNVKYLHERCFNEMHTVRQDLLTGFLTWVNPKA